MHHTDGICEAEGKINFRYVAPRSMFKNKSGCAGAILGSKTMIFRDILENVVLGFKTLLLDYKTAA